MSNLTNYWANMTPEERFKKQSELMKKRYAKTTKTQRRAQTAAARKTPKDYSANQKRFQEFWDSKTPEERSKIISERAKKDSHTTPARLKYLRKEYKNGRREKLEKGHAKWVKENPEQLYKRGKEMSSLPQAKRARERNFERQREKAMARKQKEERAKAIIKYQTNLNIKHIGRDPDNDAAVDEFFGEMI